MLAAVARVGALRGECFLESETAQERSLPKWWRAQVKMMRKSASLEANEASRRQVEGRAPENAVARRAEVDHSETVLSKTSVVRRSQGKARQAQTETSMCARCGQLGHCPNDVECPAKVKVVNWEETEEQVTEEPHPFPDHSFFVTQERAVLSDKWWDRYRMCPHSGWNSLF